METINVKIFIATFAGAELQPAETPHPKNVSVLQDTDAAVTQDANAPLIDANADFEFEAKIAEIVRYLHLCEKVQNYPRCLPHSEILTAAQILEQYRVARRLNPVGKIDRLYRQRP